MGEDKTDLSEIYAAWDGVDAAIRKIVCALPWQMTKAAEELEAAQAKMRDFLHRRDISAALLMTSPAGRRALNDQGGADGG